MADPIDCVWKDEPSEGDGYYESECGHPFVFTEGGINYNSFKFCPFCGKQIREYVYLPKLGEKK